ncbi:MAG: presqualene diphosphate synthase HpnD [Alphaproteobacteria bacterium]|nr:presqualene diphosphate synthase HpnD [Alphaproteobacteria bacterium]
MTAVPYSRALADVKARVAAARTSFHAGMLILPRPRREAMYALYAFCREVDDIADDSPTREESARGLQQWRERISSLFRGTAEDNITAALSPAVNRFGLVESDFQSIIDGMAMDAGEAICAPDMLTLDLYCDRVASAVGRVSVRIFGDASASAMKVAHHLGRAFQFTNILRDLAEDAARGRLYLPEELLTKHKIASRVPAEVLKNAGLPAVCRDLALQAQGHFASADQAMQVCKPSAMRPARIMRAYYGAIFDRLVAEDWRDPAARICLPKWKKFWLVLRHMAG